MPSEDGNDLPRLLADLAPYGTDVTLIGGWVPELYRRFGGIAWRGHPSRTTELDLLVKQSLPQDSRPKLREILVAAGLRPSSRSSGLPAVWVDPGTDVTVVEILTPRVGPPRDQVQLVEGQGMLGAIPLEDLGLQSRHTRLLSVAIGDQAYPIRVPTLGAWLVSRPLAMDNRLRAANHVARNKAAKDIAYIRDTLFAGDEVLNTIARDIDGLRTSPDDITLFEKSCAILERLCESPEDASIVRAADLISERDRFSREAAMEQTTAALHGLRSLMRAGAS